MVVGTTIIFLSILIDLMKIPVDRLALHKYFSLFYSQYIENIFMFIRSL